MQIEKEDETHWKEVPLTLWGVSKINYLPTIPSPNAAVFPWKSSSSAAFCLANWEKTKQQDFK